MEVDEDNGVAIVQLKGERTFVDSYYNMYGDLVNNKVKKNFEDEISIDFNSKPSINFFGSELYKKVTSEEITETELEKLSKDDLSYLRNEIFARKGHTFKSEKMKTYFGQKPWYRAFNDDATKTLTAIEKRNADFIKSIEDSK